MCILQSYQDLQKGIPGFAFAVLKTFVSKHLGTESSDSIAGPSPCASGSSGPCSGSSGPCSCGSGPCSCGSRPCSLPFRYKTLRRFSRTPDKHPAGQLLSQPLPSLCPGIKLRKQGQFPHFLLCWPLPGSMWGQHLIHPLDASLCVPLHPSHVPEERSQGTALQPNREVQDVPRSLSLPLV